MGLSQRAAWKLNIWNVWDIDSRANSQLYRISRDCLQIIECRSPEEAAQWADVIRQA